MPSRTFKSIKFLLEANFGLSVCVLVGGSLLSVTGSYAIFDFHEDLYGVMANNLRVMMIYLAMTEIALCSFCYVTQHFQLMLIAGFFLILLIGSLEFYGRVNQIEIDPNCFAFFLYTGISHILYGMLISMEKNQLNSLN